MEPWQLEQLMTDCKVVWPIGYCWRRGVRAGPTKWGVRQATYDQVLGSQKHPDKSSQDRNSPKYSKAHTQETLVFLLLNGGGDQDLYKERKGGQTFDWD